jgi:hypothetical protein
LVRRGEWSCERLPRRHCLGSAGNRCEVILKGLPGLRFMTGQGECGGEVEMRPRTGVGTDRRSSGGPFRSFDRTVPARKNRNRSSGSWRVIDKSNEAASRLRGLLKGCLGWSTNGRYLHSGQRFAATAFTPPRGANLPRRAQSASGYAWGACLDRRRTLETIRRPRSRKNRMNSSTRFEQRSGQVLDALGNGDFLSRCG